MDKLQMKKEIAVRVLTLFSLLTISFLFRLSAEEREISAQEISRPVSVDGNLDDPQWQRATKVSGFVQKEPEEGSPASEITELRVLYDDENLYIGVFCFDSQPDKIVANQMRRDGELMNDDYLEIIIDTYHDHRNAFYFAVNPLGAKQDALIRDEGNNVNWDWDGIWKAKAKKIDQGWAVEIAIPFYTLRFKPGQSLSWGINFGRHVARKREESYWSPVLRDFGWYGKYKISYFGHLRGLDSLKQGKRAHFMPYVIGGGDQEERGDPFSTSGDLGLDLKYRLTPNLTADVTVNTDFAQVEADQEVFNLTRFSLFFPEKRGFFLEGADIFRLGERYREHEPPSTLFFFSRTIGLSEDGREIPIIGGLRVTGKAGGFALGILDIVTDRTSYLEDDERVDIERTNFSVFRIKRDFLRRSTVGFMFLNKDSLDGPLYNRGAGFDFNLAFGSSLQMGGFAAKTFSPGLKGKDWASYLDFSYWSDFWVIDLAYTDIGENFNAEMGFIPRTDIKKIKVNTGIGPRPRFLSLRQMFIFNNFSYIQNHAGQLESRNNAVGLFNLFQNGSQLFFGFVQNYEFLSEEFEIREDVFIPEGVYKFNMGVSFLETDRTKDIAIRGEMNFGRFYNGHLFRVNASGFLKLSKHLNIEFIFDRNRFDLPVEGGKFTTHIAGSRIVYSFSPDLFAKAYLQWNDDENFFISNFLVRWIYKPGANIYFIYNETRRLGTNGYLRDRAVMLKVSFLFH